MRENTSIYHHAKFEHEQKFVQEEIKKRILHLNSYGLLFMDDLQPAIIASFSILFLLA